MGTEEQRGLGGWGPMAPLMISLRRQYIPPVIDIVLSWQCPRRILGPDHKALKRPKGTLLVFAPFHPKDFLYTLENQYYYILRNFRYSRMESGSGFLRNSIQKHRNRGNKSQYSIIPFDISVDRNPPDDILEYASPYFSSEGQDGWNRSAPLQTGRH